MFPKAGGQYVYIKKEAYGWLVGFVWLEFSLFKQEPLRRLLSQVCRLFVSFFSDKTYFMSWVTLN
jgi:hypothetical protein